jgi:methylamine---glutamate N-methyltransferase subunit C
MTAPGFPEDRVRARARHGASEVFPPADAYGHAMFGAPDVVDDLDQARLVPPVFMPQRLEKLIDLGREPTHDDVELSTVVGGFASPLPLFLSAFGSTKLGDLGVAASAQAGRLGIPMVIGENVVPVHGYRSTGSPVLARIDAYLSTVDEGFGGVVVQQSTEDADSEVWNLVYSSPSTTPLLESGRLAFELKTGQGAKPGLGGMTVLDRAAAAKLGDQFGLHDVFGGDRTLRCATPGTFTEEILRQQIRFMRNNFPRAKVWVKLHPGRDIADATRIAWEAGADAVTVDGAEGGTGWAPHASLAHVGLPLAECLRRIGRPAGCLLVTGRMWEGSRVVRGLALGATAAGLGRAALLAVSEDPENGLVRLADSLAMEARLLISALGKYRPDALGPEDLWWPGTPAPARELSPAIE